MRITQGLFQGMRSFRFMVLVMMVFSLGTIQASSENPEGGEESVGDMIMHHVLDSHEWHIVGDLTIPLPIVLYHQGQGLQVFMSSNFHHGTTAYNGYAMSSHEHIVYENPDGTINEEETANIIDVSITKNVVTLFMVLGLMLYFFISAARGYVKNEGKAPTGLQSFFEPVVVFIRDEMARPVIGEKNYERFMPYLLTVFFFIWIGNMLGLVPFLPGGANLTGNITVALVLAACSLILILVNGNKHYWQHVFAMPGVPIPVLFILTPIELIGVFLKPIVLMIRLFANITAGHITILAFVALIFIMGEISPAAGWGVSIASVALSVFMTFLELIVAFLQAFIFTLLSATYFAAATEEAHH